ncbi:MAG: NAD(P)H-hydrate dehydratase [Candidatus Margulisiibacteriota bacterium]
MLKSEIKKVLPKRHPGTHKGDYGRVLIVAGSKGMLGAGVLAARAALRAGAGVVYWAVPDDLVNLANTITPEIIVIQHKQITEIKVDVVAIGPGLGTSEQTKKLLSLVVSLPAGKAGRQSLVVIDADALNVIAKHPQLLPKDKNKDKNILTPHPGEMSRLLGQSVASIQADRPAAAKLAAAKFNAIVVLKGDKTVVANPQGKVYLNNTGNPGMGTAGSGDVLTGLIAGLLGQVPSAYEAAQIGVYLHGLAGDLAAKEKGEVSLIASDLVDYVPAAVLRNS